MLIFGSILSLKLFLTLLEPSIAGSASDYMDVLVLPRRDKNGATHDFPISYFVNKYALCWREEVPE